VPTSTGFVQPNSWIEAAMAAICAGLWVRGLLARGIKRSIGQRSIWMSTLTGSSGTRRFDGNPDYKSDLIPL
jgi:hypothetical protein